MEPEDYPDKRDALVGDFRNYLSILKSVHSGADLAASAQVSSWRLASWSFEATVVSLLVAGAGGPQGVHSSWVMPAPSQCV